MASQTTRTRSTTTTVECDGYCDDTVAADNTMDVVAGHAIAEGDRPKPYVSVTGVDGGAPVMQSWCPDCSESRFGVGRETEGRPSVATAPCVTARTVAAFVLGVTLTLVAASLFIV